MLAIERWDMSCQCALSSEKATCILGPIKSSVASRMRKGILPLMRPHLEHCIQLCGSQNRKDMELLELLQRRAMKMIGGMEHLLHDERLRELGLYCLIDGHAPSFVAQQRRQQQWELVGLLQFSVLQYLTRTCS